ncbi:MAG: hypothetical protein KatS3mg002_0568 [Candidatus Woesearchaeota archaeon]|nr:MAG: hypothetical protein KatS3mg002_0568 [Candidatus Woesearchaeota archaeon]
MKGFYVLLLVLLLSFGCVNNISDNKSNNNKSNNNSHKILYNNSYNSSYNKSIPQSEVYNMRIYSPEFNDNSMIPKKFTCQGQDINPQLLFEDIPENAKTLVLIMDDPDAPMGTWVHWVLFNIPSDVTGIPEDSVPDNAVQGLNSWSKNNYGGPCPPSGTHRYFFKLYAIDTELALDDTATKKDVEQAMQGHIIEKAEYVGLYKKE